MMTAVIVVMTVVMMVVMAVESEILCSKIVANV